MGEYQSDQYYDFPKENESYVHRIARTRKSGKSRTQSPSPRRQRTG